MPKIVIFLNTDGTVQSDVCDLINKFPEDHIKIIWQYFVPISMTENLTCFQVNRLT